MGLYDRDYGREDDMSPCDRYQRSQQPKSMVIILLVITAAIYFIDMLSAEPLGGGDTRSRLATWFACYKDTLIQPWLWFQFLSYGFLHDQANILHVAFNMLGLFVFGRTLEQRLGRWEFLRFYLVAIVVGGIVGSATFWVMGSAGGAVIGASGAVSALIILFACVDPHATLLLFGVWPIKAWVLATIFLITNIYGSMSMFSGSDNVMGGGTAYTVHLAGAAFAYLYFRQQWNLRFLDVSSFGSNLQRSLRRTKLKIHDPDAKLRKESEDVDRILAKIHESGEQSLTRAERNTLERHSRRQRENRQRRNDPR